nr:hypothetical protein [Marinicella sp. W31]MDC2875571.1 hypothetical protein [Marinicella sp. W31]
MLPKPGQSRDGPQKPRFRSHLFFLSNKDFNTALEAGEMIVERGLESFTQRSEWCCHINSPSLPVWERMRDQAAFAAISLHRTL